MKNPILPSMDAQRKSIYEKIASMLAMGVPDVQIAEAVGLSAGRITQLKTEEEFLSVFREKAAEVAQEQEEINQGWDEIEKKSLKIVSDSLRYNKNPDFALKAAMVANRATRRGQGTGIAGNEPLSAKLGSSTVVIQLNQTFVNKLQSLKNATPTIEAQGPPAQVHNLLEAKKKVNMLAPGQVKTLLSDVLENDDRIIDASDLGEFDLVGN